jgi:CBS domain-containing protein
LARETKAPALAARWNASCCRLSAEATMDVRELMTHPIQTLAAEETLNCAAKLMRDQAIGCIPIVDAGGTLCGILTDRDIALGAHVTGEALWRLRIAEHMRAPVVTCRADDAVDVAARTMRLRRVRRLPVLDDAGRPIGMISLDDLAHASRQPILEPTPGMTADELSDVVDATSGRSKHTRVH